MQLIERTWRDGRWQQRSVPNAHFTFEQTTAHDVWNMIAEAARRRYFRLPSTAAPSSEGQPT